MNLRQRHSRRMTYRAPDRCRGTVMLLVIAALLLMLILGMSYMEVVRQDRRATNNLLRVADIDMVTNSVLDLVFAKAAQDMAFQGDKPFSQDNGDGVDAFDYPGEADPWLSPTVPVDSGTQLLWPHITLLTDRYADEVSVTPRGNAELYRNPAGGMLVAEDASISDNQAITSTNGAMADADGDYVVDSKWFQAPLFSLRGRDYYAAVRVVDMSSLMNVNTATSMIDASGVYGSGANRTRGYFSTNIDLGRLARVHAPSSGTWSGELPTLLGYRGVSAALPTPIGLTSANVQTPEGAAASSATERFFNHVQAYGISDGKYGIVDEFEMRHRNGLNIDDTDSFIETTAIADTLMNRTSTAKKYSDMTSNSYAGRQTYFLGGAPATSPFTRAYPTIRSMLTTYNGAVDYNATSINPDEKYKFDLRGENGGATNGNTARVNEMYRRIYQVMNHPSQTAGVGYRGIAIGSDAMKEAAYQLALNIQDYTDPDNKPTVGYPADVSTGAARTFLGNEKRPYIRAVYLQAGYIDTDVDNVDADGDAATGTDRWVLEANSVAIAVEIGNPFPQKMDFFGAGGANVKVIVNGAEVSLLGEINQRDDSNVNDTILVVSNPATPVDEGGAKSALQTDLTLPVGYDVANKRVELAANGTFTVPASTDVVVELQVEGSDNMFHTYDKFTVTGFQLPAELDHSATNPEDTRANLGNRHHQAVAERNCQAINYLSNAGKATRVIKTIDTVGYATAGHNLADDAKPTSGAGLDPKFQMTCADRPMYTPAEIGWMFALCGIVNDTSSPSPAVETLPEVIDNQSAVTDYTLNLTSLSDIPRIPHGMAVIDQFTSFSTRYDGVDNDLDGDTDLGSDTDEHFQPGKMNINTMSYESLCLTMPMPEAAGEVQNLVRAIIGYRDSGDYDDTGNPLQNRNAVRANGSLDSRGIASIGELLAVRGSGGAYDMQRYGWDSTDQAATAVNMYPMPEDVNANTAISAPDSSEELMARLQFISGAYTTRSDVFAAYVRVRGFPSGQTNHNAAVVEKQIVVIFSRANMLKDGDSVEVLGIYEY